MNNRLIVATAAIAGGAVAALGQTIRVLEPAPGYQYSEARYVSPNGTVVGFSANGFMQYTPIPTRWSPSSVPEVLSLPGGAAEADRCSDDGSVVVGRYLPDINNNYPIMWDSTGGHTLLSTPFGSGGVANGVSSDGTIVTGGASSTQGRWLVRWENGTQVQSSSGAFLPGPCSAEGNMALGVIYTGGNSASLGRWTSSGGANGTIQNLGQFPATMTGIRAPSAMTPAGDAAIGWYSGGSGLTRSWIWRQGAFMDTGLAPSVNAESVLATAIGSNGNLAAGYALERIGQFTFQTHAVVWEQETGWVAFADYLVGLGMGMPGWEFHSLRYITPDGRTFVGQAVTPEGVSRGFVITVPAPANMAVAGMVGLAAARRRRTVRAVASVRSSAIF